MRFRVNASTYQIYSCFFNADSQEHAEALAKNLTEKDMKPVSGACEWLIESVDPKEEKE